MADTDPSLTPEQRLLKLIEEPSASASRAEQEASPKEEREKGKAEKIFQLDSLLSTSALKGRLAYAKEQFSAMAGGGATQVDLKQINRTVKMMTGGLAFFFAVAMGFEMLTTGKGLSLKMDSTMQQPSTAPVPEGRLYDVDLFEEKDRRNVFVPYVKPPEPEHDETKKLSLKLVEITKDLKLTGISIYPGDPGRTFCMVEDIKKNVTTFLKAGDSISGLTVSEIKPDSVILTHEKERIELR